MTEKELQELIRLKRYEQPEEGYFEDFLAEFHQRQRSEMLRASSLRLLVERARTWCLEVRGTQWAASAAVACALIALFIQFTSAPEKHTGEPAQVALELNVDSADSCVPVSHQYLTPLDLRYEEAPVAVDSQLFF